MITLANLSDSIRDARDAGAAWADVPVRRRCQLMRSVRRNLVSAASELCELVTFPQRDSHRETLSAEIIPFCDALRFLTRHGQRILRSRRVGFYGQPIWLWGTYGHVHRSPWGRVLILAPWNFPIYLAGVQAAQGLVAGNSILWKSAPGCEAVTAKLVECFQQVIGPKVVQQVSSDPDVASALIDAGMERVVLTGGTQTGQIVGAQCGAQLTPTTMELGGSDAMIVTDHANVSDAAKALRFGLYLNSSATCIAPRRIYVHQEIHEAFLGELSRVLDDSKLLTVEPRQVERLNQLVGDAVQRGATVLDGKWNADSIALHGFTEPLVVTGIGEDSELMQSDIFAPVAGVATYQDEAALVRQLNQSRYGLGASVFGKEKDALRLADQLRVGTVTINDLIVPSADPRVPFGGQRSSGFGTTRGAEGLIEMTCPKTIMVRRGRGGRHLAPPNPGDIDVLEGFLNLAHAGSITDRYRGLKQMIRGARNQDAMDSGAASND